MGKPGRKPIEPRIEKLEIEFARLETELHELRQRFALAPTIDVPRGTYQSQFDKWPGNGGA